MLDPMKTTLRRLARETFDRIMTIGPPKPIVPEIVRSRGQIVLDEAVAQLKLNIKEPTKLFKNGAAAIDRFIRFTGLKWNTADALTWKKDAPYVKNGQFQWCGAFAAHCYAAAGLSPRILHDFFSSASRLFDRGPVENGKWTGTDNGIRLIKPEDIKPGDLLVMGYVRGGEPVPSHIGLTWIISGTKVQTIEGNASGYPFGWNFENISSESAKYEGVITQQRKLNPKEGEYGILRIIRPIEEDYVN